MVVVVSFESVFQFVRGLLGVSGLQALSAGALQGPRPEPEPEREVARLPYSLRPGSDATPRSGSDALASSLEVLRRRGHGERDVRTALIVPTRSKHVSEGG